MCFLKFLHTPVTQFPTLSKDNSAPFTTSVKPFTPNCSNQQKTQNIAECERMKLALLNCLKTVNLNSQAIHRLDNVVFSLFRNWKKVINFCIEVMIYFQLTTPSIIQMLHHFHQRLWRVGLLRLRGVLDLLMTL
jgi:hypothetical protein